MLIRNFKALDMPSSMFGIRGKFIYIPGAGIFVGLISAVLLKAIIGDSLAILLFLVVVGVAYLLAIILQSRMSERDFLLSLDKNNYPTNVTVPPEPFRNILNNDTEYIQNSEH